VLFGETQSRIVISFSEKDLDIVKKIADSFGAPFTVIGRVGGGSLRINGLIELSLTEMAGAWRETFFRLQERL
jgi:phosphoribosylformylglycinamidine synthase